MAEGALTKFLAIGTEVFEWLVTNAITLVQKLQSEPVTAVYLIIGLVSFIFVTYKAITHR